MRNFIVHFIKYHFKGFIKFLFYVDYRRYIIIKFRFFWLGRYKEKSITLFGKRFLISDINSFLSAYYAIFVENIYHFKTDKSEPLIIDCGANVGVSVLYFKKHFPNSKIIAFEADPAIFGILKTNVNSYKLKDVTLYNKAVWDKNDRIPFKVEGADAGRVDFECTESILIPTIKLSEILANQKVEFLKIDIEGAELAVIKESKEFLSNVKYAFVEFHSYHNRNQELDTILNAFQVANFRYFIKTNYIPNHPFLQITHDEYGIDLSLNISFISNV